MPEFLIHPVKEMMKKIKASEESLHGLYAHFRDLGLVCDDVKPSFQFRGVSDLLLAQLATPFTSIRYIYCFVHFHLTFLA